MLNEKEMLKRRLKLPGPPKKSLLIELPLIILEGVRLAQLDSETLDASVFALRTGDFFSLGENDTRNDVVRFNKRMLSHVILRQLLVFLGKK